MNLYAVRSPFPLQGYALSAATVHLSASVSPISSFSTSIDSLSSDRNKTAVYSINSSRLIVSSTILYVSIGVIIVRHFMPFALRRVYAGEHTNLATLVALMDKQCFCSVVDDLSGEDHFSADTVFTHHSLNVCHRCLLIGLRIKNDTLSMVVNHLNSTTANRVKEVSMSQSTIGKKRKEKNPNGYKAILNVALCPMLRAFQVKALWVTGFQFVNVQLGNLVK